MRENNLRVKWGGEIPMCSAAGGRNEETYSKYAEGIRVKKCPSRRQHKQTLKLRLWVVWSVKNGCPREKEGTYKTE